MRQKQIYIAGPMSGYKDFNFPAFFEAAKGFEVAGWKVWNPAAKETEAEVEKDTSFSTGDAKTLVANGWDYKGAITWDLEKVINSDAIHMLSGWEFSPGATAEHAVAKFIKKQNPEYKIIYA